MNFRLTLALVIILLGTLALYIGIESKRNAPPAEPEVKNALLSPQPAAINTIAFTQDGQKQVAFARAGNAWSLTFPVKAPAVEYSVSGIADTLKSLTYKDKFEPDAAGIHSPEATGTDKPRNVITFTDDANKQHTLDLGKTTVGGVYATLDGGKTIYLLATDPAKDLDQDPSTFRDKTLKETPADNITALTIKHADQTVSLVKTGDKWMIDAPVSARANAAVAQDIVNEMKDIRAASFSDFAKDMPATGLKKPLVTVTAWVAQTPPAAGSSATKPAASQPAKTPITLELGYFTDLVNKKNVYASLAGSNDVFTVTSDTFNKLNKKLNDLRDPAITPAPVADATHVSIEPLDAPALTLAKNGVVWSMTTNDKSPPLRADGAAVTDLLANVRDLRAIKFVDDAGDLKSIGLAPPRMRIDFTLPGQSQHEVLLVGKPENADAVTPVMRQGEPTVYLVQTPEMNKLSLTPADLRDRIVEGLTEPEIRAVHIAGPDAPSGGIALERSGLSWKVAKDGKTAAADAEKVASLLADFTPLTAVKYVAAGETISGKPDVTVTLTLQQSTVPATQPVAGPATRPAAMGPNPTRTVTRVLRLYDVDGGWKALWDGASAPEWTFEPSAGLVDRLTKTTYETAATKPAK